MNNSKRPISIKVIELISQENDGPCILGEVENVPISFLIDTGASVTIINPRIYENIDIQARPVLQNAEVMMTMADGKNLNCLGKGSFRLKINGECFNHQIWVADITMDGILGYDFLQAHECCLDFAHGEMLCGELPRYHTQKDEEQGKCYHIAMSETVVVLPECEMVIPAHFVCSPETVLTGIVEPSNRFIERHGLLKAYEVMC